MRGTVRVILWVVALLALSLCGMAYFGNTEPSRIMAEALAQDANIGKQDIVADPTPEQYRAARNAFFMMHSLFQSRADVTLCIAFLIFALAVASDLILARGRDRKETAQQRSPRDSSKAADGLT